MNWRFEFQTARGLDFVVIELPNHIRRVADAKAWFSKTYKSELLRVVGRHTPAWFDAFPA
jgi:hypothetical protein